MSGIGIVQDEIAAALQISTPTLRHHFREELSQGKTKTIARVADSLVRQALAGNITAAIFYLKAQAGWRDRAEEKKESKKAQRQASADQTTSGGGKFAQRPGPRLVSSNP